MNNTKYKSKTYQKRPLSIIVGGVNKLGIELADILLQNNGYVLFVDNYNKENLKKLDTFSKDSLISFIDYSALTTLDEDLKRLDYVFFLNNGCLLESASQKYLSKRKNYLDIILSLSAKYRAKFLLSTSIHSQTDSEAPDNIIFDIEFKKYSEKLTKEYINKVNLNGRIVVLGELLGDGMDFECNSIINSLVLNAAKGEPLKIPKKGMQKEWFIHVIDAAYALFKAQFSRVTNEKTYLAAYEYPYTYISIAYKIQEIERDAQDIEFFEDEKFSTDNLKIPQSLNEVGWSPKISLEKALKQSVASAKIFLLESIQDDEKRGMVRRVRAFFELSGQNPEDLHSNNIDGPVGRLIIERKRQEEQARRTLSENAKLIEDHKMKRPSQLTEAIEESSQNLWESTKERFGLLRTQKRSRVVKISIFLLILFFIYFVIVSPALILSRNVVIGALSYNNLQNELVAKDYPSMQKSAYNISYVLEDTNFVLSKYAFIFNLFNKGAVLEALSENLAAYKLYTDGISDISGSLNPLFNYADNYDSSLALKSKEEGYLVVEGEGNDYENQLLEISDRAPYIKLGLDKMETSVSRFTQINYSEYPSTISEFLLRINQQIREQQVNFSRLESTEYIPELLGVYEERTYAFLLLDNTTPTPVGGKLQTIIYLKILNGDVSEVQVKQANDSSLTLENSDRNTIDKINLTAFNKIESIGKINDYEYITDPDEYIAGLSGFFKSNFGSEIDGAVVLNYSALESFIYRFSGQFNFESDGVNFSKDSLLGYFSKILENPEALNKKYEVSTDLFSQLFYYLLSDLDENIISIFTQGFEDLEKQNIYVDIPNSEYSSYVAKENLNFTAINSADIFIKTAVSASDNEISTNYVNADITSSLLVTADGILSFKTLIAVPEGLHNSNLSICIPLFVEADQIQVLKIAPEQVKINRGDSMQCIVLNIKEESEVEVGWNIRSFSLTENPTELDLVIGKIKGVSSNLTFVLTLEPGVKLIETNSNLTQDGQNYSIVENLSSDKGIKLTISK